MTYRQGELDEIRAKAEAHRAERERRHREQWYGFIRLPRHYWNVSSEMIPDTAPYKAEITAWVHRFYASVRNRESAYGLYLWGPMGSGKTAVAAALLRAAYHRHILGVWIAYADLAMHAKDSPIYVPDVDNERTVWEAARDLPLVVVDDFMRGVRGTSYDEYTLTLMEQLVRERWSQGLATIITSNAALAEIEAVSPTLAGLVQVIEESTYQVEVDGVAMRKFFAQDKPPLLG